MPRTAEPVRLAGSALNRSCHVCGFFHSKEEEYRVLMPFIKDGFQTGDRAFHVVDPKHRPDHLKRLEEEGIDVADAESKGQLEVRRWQEAYLKGSPRSGQEATRQAHPAGGEHGVGARRLARRPRRRGVRNPVEPRPAGVPRSRDLHLRPVPVRRQRGDRHHADAPDGHHRRHPAREPVLRPA